MTSKEKTVVYSAQNIYLTKNELAPTTKNVWLVFHGIGYLAKYFAKYFDALDPTENYVVIPQASSKYYLKNEYKYVGASWLTKENTQMEIKNVLNYIDAVFQAEKIPAEANLILFGFSQGVSIATRWMVHNRIRCKALLLYAGGIPNELTEVDFDFLDYEHTSVKIIYGNQDSYLNPERLKTEKPKIRRLFQGKAEIITFEGGHEMKSELIPTLI
ncbi:esterase [Muricauda sp. JGD-17]|uniref:Esterase n=1 Tax=Flagellimonas ochracea TaxID=2696472 RepID=A0A964TA98_9FLAO|nr:esterase [Allomuricauda ochracea]NAY91152.1 esterase [Allomuricauda ochracea]